MTGQINAGHDIQHARGMRGNSAAKGRRAAIVDYGCVCPEVQDLAGAVMVLVDSGVGFAVFRYFLCHVVGDDYGNSGVMDYAAISRENFCCLHPFVFGKVGGDVDVFVIVLTRAWHGELGDGEHHVGLDVPAFGKDRSRREIFRVTFAGAGSDPGVDGRDVGGAEAGIVQELAYIRIGVPGRHLALHDSLTNRAGPGTSVFIGHQRHGSDVVGAMAGDTVLVQDGSYVAVVGDFLGGARVCRTWVVLTGS